VTQPRWLGKALVLALHERSVAEHGGRPGLRDEGLLDSALMRPRNLAAYGDPDLCTLAAAYLAAIVRNHPFLDGNKRTGFMAAYVFLADNGLRLTAPEAETARMVIALAAGELEDSAMADWLRRNAEPRQLS
jgi:death-on-curing protein